MKLLIAIVRNENAQNVMRALANEEIRVTKLSSTGGFFKAGNTTFLIGTNEEDIEWILSIIKAHSEHSTVEKDKEKYEIHGAHIFILDIDDYFRM